MNEPIQAVPLRPLPGEVRAVVWACVIASALVGFGAVQDAGALLQLDAARETGAAPPLLNPALSAAIQRGMTDALIAMRGPRLAVVVALSMVSMFGFMSALRLLKPGPLPRESVRRIAGGAALIAGVLRTLSGALDAVVFQRLRSWAPKLAPAGGDGELTYEQLLRISATGGMVVMIGLTVLMAGTLIASGQYLRSERARQRIAEADG